MKHRYHFIICFLLCLFSIRQAFAQLATLHIEKYNNQIWLKVALSQDHPDSLFFLFDSGAGTGLLSTEAATKYFADRPVQEISATGAGGISKMRLLQNCTIYLHGLAVNQLSFVVNDLTGLRNSIGRRFDGIIGYGLLSRFVTQLDLDKELLCIYKDIADLSPEGEPMHFQYSSQLSFAPIIHATLTGLDGKAYAGDYIMDSGAALATILNTPYVDSLQLLTSLGKTMKFSGQSLTGTDVRYQAHAKSFTFNGHQFLDIQADLSQTASGVSSQRGYAGLMGNQLIYRFNLVFDYAHQIIYMQPNHYYHDLFPLPHSGITFAKHGEKLVINAIDPGSPEAKLDLHVNEEIISLNGKPITDLVEAKKLLQQTGKLVMKVKQETGEASFNLDLYPRI